MSADRLAVNPDWWKTLFDEVYLRTDARSVCNDELTGREIDLICELLPIRRRHRILDLCGGHGRHSFELCARGFLNCTLVDYSPALIRHARKQAEARQCHLECIRSDARKTGLPSGRFHHVLLLGNSLGYVQDPDADHGILAEAYRLCHPGGWLLVDVADGSAIRKNFAPKAWHEIDPDMVVCRMRELQGDTVCAREMVLSKETGLIRDKTYAIRIYEAPALAVLLEDAGFLQVAVRMDNAFHRKKGDYGFMNHRMIALGQKPATAE